MRVFILALIFLSACATQVPAPPVAPRSVVNANMPAIIEVEARASRLAAHIQIVSRMLSQEVVLEIKRLFDVYSVYHLSATLALGRGDLTSYHAALQLARAELEQIEDTLKGKKA